jgi:large subunit ribosomal protein L29
MKTKEIRELSLGDLSARKRELCEEVFHLRLQKQSGQLEKPSQLRSIRREIARIETFITQKSRAASGAK